MKDNLQIASKYKYTSGLFSQLPVVVFGRDGKALCDNTSQQSRKQLVQLEERKCEIRIVKLKAESKSLHEVLDASAGL